MALLTLHREDSQELAAILHSLSNSDIGFESTRAMASFLGCSRRTARRAATYARGLARAAAEVRHG